MQYKIIICVDAKVFLVFQINILNVIIYCPFFQGNDTKHHVRLKKLDYINSNINCKYVCSRFIISIIL